MIPHPDILLMDIRMDEMDGLAGSGNPVPVSPGQDPAPYHLPG